MINLWIAFRNPFPVKPFRMIRCWEKGLSKHKSFEFQISRYAFNWLEFQLDLNWRQTDHAGPWIMIGLFGIQLDVRLYDTRHWDDKVNNWKE